MMMPSLFTENLFDDFFNDFDEDFFGKKNPLYGKHARNMMKTDVRETDTTYEVDVDLPGFKKEDINVNYENGYLTISTSKGLDKDEKDKDGHYIRQERYVGNMTRSFYLGDIPKEDIKKSLILEIFVCISILIIAPNGKISIFLIFSLNNLIIII